MAKKSKPQSKPMQEATHPAKLAIIRIRGRTGIKKDTKDTLNLLNLKRINNCIILENNKQNIGMVRKAQDYITWGEIDDKTLQLLKEKRETGNSKVFRLKPPCKGFERGGINKPYAVGGALGNRGDRINELLRKML